MTSVRRPTAPIPDMPIRPGTARTDHAGPAGIRRAARHGIGVVFAVLVLAATALAQTGTGGRSDATVPAEPAPPYEDRLTRLAEIVGSVHFLRNLCRESGEDQWRSAIEALIAAETGENPARRALLIAAFNRGYRAFAAVYADCTPAARSAEQRYRHEAATLAREIVTRYGN